MTISGIGTTYGVSSLSGILNQTSTSGVTSTSSDGDSDDATISGPAQMLAKLKQLQQSDPAKFKEVVSKIAEQLSQAADKAGTDTADGQFLTKLASQFKKVAETGDLSALQPPPKPAAQSTAAYSASSGQSDILKALLDAQKESASSGSSGSNGSGPSDSVKSLFQQIDQEITSALS